MHRLIAFPILLVAIALAAWWAPARWTLLLWVPLLLLALYDALQRHHSLRRNFPLIGRIRWLFETLRPFLYAYIVESPLDGRPFARVERDIVYARAKGELDSHPFGTELDVYSDEYEWMSHSMAPAMAPDRTQRPTVGTAQCSQPYQPALLNISAMSFGSLGANAIEALNLGAKLGNFYHDTGEGSVSPYHRIHGGDIVWELGSGYFGCRDEAGHFDPERFRDHAADTQIKMIEIKLSQGAKPGHGGVLPGAKVSAEIAATRGVPEGHDCISPAAHSAFATPVEMILWAAKLRELSGGKPVGIKLCVGQPHEIYAVMKAMIETGIRLDFIVVDGAEGGTGAAPVEFSNSIGMPLREGLIFVRNALVGCGLKEEVRLAASGKVHSGAGLAINAALGADWSNAARAFMFTLGCVQSLKCHTDHCPTGVATQDPGRQRGLVVEDKAERVRRFQAATVNALWDISCAMGLDNPWAIRPHHLHERLNSARSDSIDRIYKFYERGVLLDDPDSVASARYWAMARADSFRAAV